MGANKKKKKPSSNPSRGFATVSTPSKKIDQNPPQPNDNPTSASDSGKYVEFGKLPPRDASVEHGATDLQQMSPEELEQHLEEAELQSLLDAHGQHAKKDVARQVTRLKTERRSLRRGGTMLETESWLPQVLEEILELARSSSQHSNTIKSVTERLSDDDLCIKLWIVHQILESLQFRKIENVLQHLIKTSSSIAQPTSSSVAWGLDEAMNWLALYADPEDLPAYQQRSFRYTTSMLPPQSPTSPSASGKTINLSRAGMSSSYSCLPPLDDCSANACSSRPKSPAKDEALITNLATVVSDDSDDNDPEQLIDKFLHAKYELLKSSMSSLGTEKEQQSDQGRDHKLRQRIQKIERDILFDRSDAVTRWGEVKKDLEIEHARSSALANRENGPSKTSIPLDHPTMKGEIKDSQSSTSEETIEEGFFDNLFALNDNDAVDGGELPAVTVVVRDFGPLGAGANPRNVLEDICKTSDPSCKVTVRQISSSSHTCRHSVQVLWSKNQEIAVSLSYLPAQLSYHFRPRLTTASMISVATSSPQQSEGYVCTVMLFIVSQMTRDEKLYLRLPSAWRDIWRELLDAKKEELDRADRTSLRLIQALIAKQREMQNGETNRQTEPKAAVRSPTETPGPLGKTRADYKPEYLKSLWEEKTTTIRYRKMLHIRQQLPIWNFRKQIIDMITVHQVIVLCAETGAGKSTQVPSFILQSQLSNGQDCKILITQPRRISAISLARRVSEELGEQRSELGTSHSLVGFTIRLESKVSAATRVTYLTTGVLLRMLESSSNLDEIDFVVLDEVHERTMDLDLIFIALRRLLRRRHNLKVVLMSATVDARRFSEYFDNAPMLSVPGRTFPVEIRYLEDAVELTQRGKNTLGSHTLERNDRHAVDMDHSERPKSLAVGLQSYSEQTRKVLAVYDEYKMDYCLIVSLIMTISSDSGFQSFSKAILVFVPGISEIRRLHQMITSSPSFQSGWVIHLLHSSFSNDDLEKAFEPPPAQHRKIVIATNIAETGITIPDVTAVIDSCREKTMRFDERRQISKLTEAFISRSSARQRRGRAARVQEGLCFHLVTRYRHDHLLLEHHVPEMLRLSLQDPILHIKMWGLGDIEQTLKEAFDPPTSKNVRRAIDLLKDVNALRKDESLTPLGRLLSKLPLDLWLGKLVLHGVIFRCLDATLFMASVLSARSPFVEGGRSDSRTAAARLAFRKGDSDLLSVYNAYCAWRRAYTSGNAHEFCRRNFLDHQTLLQIEDQKVQLLVNLSDAGILLLEQTEKDSMRRSRLGGRGHDLVTLSHRYSLNSNNEVAVNSVTALALYPKLLLRERQGWRNVANNQQVNISPTSVNYGPSYCPANWLSFYQTIQTKSKNPTVFETSPVPDLSIVTLLGEADFKMYAGVITLDGGRIRFSIRDWTTMIVLKFLRTKIQEGLLRSYRKSDFSLPSLNAKWFDIWQKVLTSQNSNAVKREVTGN